MRRVLTIAGARPNFIKITQFERVFREAGSIEYKLLHTGQHYDYIMSKVFFDQLEIREPDYFLNIKGQTPNRQIGDIIVGLEEVILEYKPDLMLVVGDVNSTLAASITANKCGIPLAHVESGLRTYDRSMPEEVNRVITDQLSAYHFTTEKSGIQNLRKEGISTNNAYFVGNTMIDTLVHFDDKIQSSSILSDLSVREKQYALMTMHRPVNVDSKEQLNVLRNIVENISKRIQLVFPVHPRTEKNMKKYKIYDELANNENVLLLGSLDYFAFQKLVSESVFIITDSGGIQEETTYRKIPCLTLREHTERPITVEIGTNELVPFSDEAILPYVEKILSGNYKKGTIPPLWDGKASERIVEIIQTAL